MLALMLKFYTRVTFYLLAKLSGLPLPIVISITTSMQATLYLYVRKESLHTCNCMWLVYLKAMIKGHVQRSETPS